MSKPHDSWAKPRSNGTHLTADEIALIKQSFIKRYTIDETAKALQCASRTIDKYYSLFRAQGVQQQPKITLRQW